MKLLVGVALLCLAVATDAAPRIVGGKDAPEGKYPYQVSLRNGNFHFCGGSILNKRWILTAAHCVQNAWPTSIRVVAGTTLLYGGKQQSYRSEYISYHENFTLSELQNDVAVIRVNEDIEFNDKVQPIALPDIESYKAGDFAQITGWGRISANGRIPNQLQEIDLKLYDQAKCKKDLQYSAAITVSHICTLTKVGEGVCNGDSGGPLVSGGFQVGIVSFGFPCAKGMPDVYTRVHTFLDWIATEQTKFSSEQ